MKVEKVYVTDLNIRLIDVSQVGDPAPGWTQVAGESQAAGIGFLDDRSQVRLNPIRLTGEETAQLLALAESVARRLEAQEAAVSP